MTTFNESRRRFLGQSSLGLLGLTAVPNLARAMEGMGMHNRHTDEMMMPKITPNKASPNFHADVELDLFCKPNAIQILDGSKTNMLQYTARLIKGPKDTLTSLPNSYLGDIIRFQKGQKVRINLHNGLSQPSVTHWHGLHVPQVMDGHPMYFIDPGETLVYEFEVVNRAGMNIYHPHQHGVTGKQVYFGLAGALIINDEEEAALDLPSGEFEIPLVIQDKQFDSDNQLIYTSMMHSKMTGFTGDKILINGRPNAHFDVASRAYRLRVMNGSTSRIYKLAWDDGMPVTVIGVDGGLLEQPEVKPYVMLAPGERLDIWADFSGRNEGSELTLKSLVFAGVLPKMGMGMHKGLIPVGSEYPICTIRVTKKVSETHKLPMQLSKFKHYEISDTANPNNPIPIGISEAPMSMLLNGAPYSFNNPLPFERVKVGSIQQIEIFHAHGAGGMKMDDSAKHESGEMKRGGMGMNRGMGGGMMDLSMAHPIHLHGQQFQTVSRSFSGDSTAYDTVREGFIDSGLKDVVLVMPMERVKIIKPFQDFKGLFLYHCHNLEHEDMGMMREFSVE
ncbi:MAG: multicopper oxidase domain-containing protein [Methylococcaceae bacterium]